MMTETVTDTISKDKWWIYLMFFLIGIFFFCIFIVLKGLIVLPLLICSILFAITMYKLKKQSFGFAGRAFAISFATSYLIFFIGYFGGHFIDVWFPLLFYLLILLVFSAISWVAFKEQPLYNFTLKAFVVSFGTFFIIFSAMFITNYSQDATSSTSIHIESRSENITIYFPVLLDENKNVLKMYENPEITGDVTTAVIDTEYGKALMISRSGLGDHLFNWNEVPGKDTDRFVGWLEDTGSVGPWKPDISKSDDGRAITVFQFGRSTSIYRLNEEGVLEFYGVNNNRTHEIFGEDLLFTKEENDQLNIYPGNNEISMNEKHGILKEDTQASDEFFKGFTISMSNYTSPESFIPRERRTFGAWVYSDSEVEKVRFYFYLDPNLNNRIDGRHLSMGTKGWVHLSKGWQVVNLTAGIGHGD
jgi:hypothetical protein